MLLGLGTAMVYPTLLAAIGDVAHPTWRASAVGVYRLWRDLGYAIGALLAGIAADALGLHAAMWLVAASRSRSGLVAAVRMRETLRARRGPSCMTIEDLAARLDRQEPLLLLDVRSPEEFAGGHVAGARNVPLPTLEEASRTLARDALVVTVCGKGGGRSNAAAALLRTRGFGKVVALCGGVSAWIDARRAT